MVTQDELNTMSAWMSSKENMDKLTIEEQLAFNASFMRHMNEIAPIIQKAMARDTESASFLFKL